MYVSMTPHGESGKVLNCSQNDGSERKWEIQLYDQNSVIDGIASQTVFPVSVGGTEEVISDGLSTPIIADIEYPDETRTDQIFTERTSPTTEDGNAEIVKMKGSSLVFNQKAWNEYNAEIKSIKGNTIKFNQLVQNGNFADTSPWQNYSSSFTVNNNVATVKSTNVANQFGIYQRMSFISGHKYFISFETKKYGTITLKRNRFSSGQDTVQEGFYSTIETASSDLTIGNAYRVCFGEPVSDISTDYFSIKNYMIIDLTAIFGSGNEPATVSDFETWLSNNIGLLPYYDYTPGTLIPFMGTGLKTIGFNQWDEVWELGNIYPDTGGNMTSDNTIRSKNYIPVFPNTEYYACMLANKGIQVMFYNNTDYLGIFINIGSSGTFITPQGATRMRFRTYVAYGSVYNNDICINISDTSRNGEYEPYISNTLSLPISTYFPTGMKSAGSVYDELSDKAYTRVGSVDLGTLTWSRESWTDTGITYVRFRARPIGMQQSSEVTDRGILISDGKYIARIGSDRHLNYSYWRNGDSLFIYDNAYASANDFKTAVSGVILNYELATPTETDIYLDLTYPIWNGGTEQILPVNESTPTTSAFKGEIEYADGLEETEFLYKQTKSGVLISGHSYITRINNVWSNVQGTGQTISYGEGDMIIDLTQMASPYITNYSQFAEYFSDDYEFNKGQLVSFIGQSINGVALPQMTNGMKSVNSIYDEITETSKTQRIGMRAYQSGDENNTNVLTDLINTLYVLDSPIEQTLKTAALVCKNVEMPINNGVVECDSRVSEDAGMYNAKVKLVDGDGVAYSEKLSIFVERKPK